MIISHRYKYLFIEIPNTGSWSIREVLCQHYNGESILHKHATYPEFDRLANPEEKKYFVFGTVRNPLDVLVSRYIKHKTNFKGLFSDTQTPKHNTGDYSDLAKYKFLQETNAAFADYVRKFHTRQYSDLIDIASSRYDFVMRYENLDNDFRKLLTLLKIDGFFPIPVTNVTPEKQKNWLTYYTPDITAQIMRVFAISMGKWGYQFPETWGDYHPSKIVHCEYQITKWLRENYLLNVRFKQNLLTKSLRKIRARIIQ